MRISIGDVFLGLSVALYIFSAGMGCGSCLARNPDMVLDISCKSACERQGSEMQSVQENVCLCKNLKAMRGDYGQLFLHGEQ